MQPKQGVLRAKGGWASFLHTVFQQPGGALKRPQRRFAYTLLLPILVYTALFSLFPIAWAFTMSFFDYSPVREGAVLGLGKENPFVGLDNYRQLAVGRSKPSRIFRISVKNTLIFTLLVVPINLAISLPLAVMLESVRHRRVRTFFRLVYFLPAISASVALVIIWSYVYAPGYGLLSEIVRMLGFRPPKSWLQDPRAFVAGIPLAMWCVAVAYAWQIFGYNVVVFVAALQSIPQDIKEAARVDGAGPLQAFWYVTVPLLKRTVLLASVTTMLISMKEFVIFQLLTRGGPAFQTYSIMLSIYNTAFFRYNVMGLAAAMSVFLFVVLAVLSAIQFRLLRAEWEY